MAKKKTIRTIPQQRTPMPEQEARARAKNFTEVACGYRPEDALNEAERCLLCPDPKCIAGCPVSINIPEFIQRITAKDFRGAVLETAKTVGIEGEPSLVRPQRERRTLLDLFFGDVSSWIPDRAKLLEQNPGFYFLWK